MMKKDTRKAGKLSLVSIALCFLINNLILKNLVDRDRPYEVLNDLKILIERQPDSSFPSGHAANSLASAIVFYKLFEKKIIKLGELFKGYCNVDVVYNNIGLDNWYKCSPFDGDENIWHKLYESREIIC